MISSGHSKLLRRQDSSVSGQLGVREQIATVEFAVTTQAVAIFIVATFLWISLTLLRTSSIRHKASDASTFLQMYFPRHEKYHESKEYMPPTSNVASLPHLVRPHAHRPADHRRAREFMWDRPPVPKLPLSKKLRFFLTEPFAARPEWLTYQRERMRISGLDIVSYLLFGRALLQIVALWALAALLLAIIDYDKNLQQDARVADIGFFTTSSLSNENVSASKGGDFAFGVAADGITAFVSILRVGSGDIIWFHLALAYWNTFVCLFVSHCYYGAIIRLRKAWFEQKLPPANERLDSIVHDKTLILFAGADVEGREGVQLRTLSELDKNKEVHNPLPDLIRGYQNNILELESRLTTEAGAVKPKNGLLVKALLQLYRCAKPVSSGPVEAHHHNKHVLHSKRLEELRLLFAGHQSCTYAWARFQSSEEARLFFRGVLASKEGGKDFKRHLSLMCPHPKDIAWESLATNKEGTKQKKSTRRLASAVLSIVTVLYSMAIASTAWLSTLNLWAHVIPALHDFYEWKVLDVPLGAHMLTMGSSLLPSLLALGIRFFLPMGIEKLAWLQKPLTKSRALRMEVSWLFTTLLCGSFLLFTVANLLFSILGNHLAREATLSDSFDATVDEMSRSASETAQQVFDGYIIASRYWLTWLPTTLAGSFAGHLQFERIHSRFLVYRLAGRSTTPREQIRWQSPSITYHLAERAGNLLLIFAVTCAYSPLCPIITLAALLVILPDTCLAENENSDLFFTTADSGGRIFRVLLNRLLFCQCILTPTSIAVATALRRGNVTYLLGALPCVFATLLWKLHWQRNLLHPRLKLLHTPDPSAYTELFNWGGRLPSQSQVPVPLPVSKQSSHEPAEFDLRSEASKEQHEWPAVVTPEVLISLYSEANDAVVRLLTRLLAGKMGQEDPLSEGTARQNEDPPRLQIFYDGQTGAGVRQVRDLVCAGLQQLKEPGVEPTAANVLLLSKQLEQGL